MARFATAVALWAGLCFEVQAVTLTSDGKPKPPLMRAEAASKTKGLTDAKDIDGHIPAMPENSALQKMVANSSVGVQNGGVRAHCSFSGDPHTLTFDTTWRGGGHWHPMHAPGHWYMVRSKEDRINVQATYAEGGIAAWGGWMNTLHNGISRTVTTGIAIGGTFLGANGPLVVQPPCEWDYRRNLCTNTDKQIRILWNGARVNSINSHGVSLTVSGNYVHILLPLQMEVKLWFHGAWRHDVPWTYLDGIIWLNQGQAGTICGHCGNFNGNVQDDLIYDMHGRMTGAGDAFCDATVTCNKRYITDTVTPCAATFTRTLNGKEMKVSDCPLAVRIKVENECKKKIVRATKPAIVALLPAAFQQDETQDCVLDGCLDKGFIDADAIAAKKEEEAQARLEVSLGAFYRRRRVVNPNRVVILHNAVHKRYIRANNEVLDTSPVVGSPAFYSDSWISERWTVVAANRRRDAVAFHNAHFNRFMKMSDAQMMTSPVCAYNKLPDDWNAERFLPRELGDGYVGFWNPTFKRWIRMDGAKMEASDVGEYLELPATWKYPRFTIIEQINVLRVGTVVALHNAVHNRFLRMNGANLDSSGVMGFASLPLQWTWERFTVVDAGNGEIALHSGAHDRFIKVGGGSPQCDMNQLPKTWLAERFSVVHAGNGLIALFNENAGRYLRMHGAHVDYSPVQGAESLPEGWTWERFHVLVLANTPLPVAGEALILQTEVDTDREDTTETGTTTPMTVVPDYGPGPGYYPQAAVLAQPAPVSDPTYPDEGPAPGAMTLAQAVAPEVEIVDTDDQNDDPLVAGIAAALEGLEGHS